MSRWSRFSLAAVLLGVLIGGSTPVLGEPSGPADPATVAGGDDPGLDAEGYVSASVQTSEGGVWTGDGLVSVRYRGVVIEAEHAELNRATGDLVATGNVVLQEGNRRLAGERIEYNLETRSGRLWKVWGFSDPDVYFTANEVSKQGEKVFSLSRPTVTSCNQANPIWRIKASSGKYVADEYIRLWNARFEVLGVPLLWMPYFQYPAKQERATGFLFPSVGSNNVRGFYMANAFFWAISRSYDTTLTHEWYPGTASIVRSDWEWSPAQGARGKLSTENLFEQETEHRAGRYALTHNQNWRGGWQLGADVQYATDESLDREYNNSINRITQRTRSSNAFLARRWSHWNFATSMHHAEVLGERERTDFFLPSVELATRDTRLAGPIYARGGLRGANFGSENSSQEYRWQRADFDPTLSAPLVPFPWLQLKPEVTYRLTYYSNSYAPDTNRSVFTEADFLRRYLHAGARLTGPVFSKVTHTSGKLYSDKFKHVIEPSVSYDYTSDFDPDDQALNFDSVDRLTRQNQVTFALRNRFYAKRPSGHGNTTIPYEFLTIAATMGYSLDPDLFATSGDSGTSGSTLNTTLTRRGPLVGDVRFAPSPAVLMTYRVSYDTLNGYFAQQSVQSSWRADRMFAELAWSRGRNETAVNSQTVRGRLSAALVAGRFDLGGGGSYDAVRKVFLETNLQAVWHTQCCGVGFGYQRRRIGTVDDNEFRFSLSLKNVGTVFDYTTGDNQL